MHANTTIVGLQTHCRQFFFNHADSGKRLAPHTTSIKFSDLIEKSKNYFFWHRLCLAWGRHFSFVSLLRIVCDQKSLWLVNREDSKWTSARFVRCSRTGLPCPAPRMYPRVNFFSESEKFCGEIAAAIDLPKRLKRNLPSPQPPSFPNLAPVSCLLIRVKAAPRYSGVSNVWSALCVAFVAFQAHKHASVWLLPTEVVPVCPPHLKEIR